MQPSEIAEAFTLLRQLCDPRGHPLLTALENFCLVESVALEAVLDGLREVQPSNVIPLIRDYSVKT